MNKTDVVANLRLASKEHIDWALREGEGKITGVDLSHRQWCFERGCELHRIADDLELDCLTYTLDCWKKKKESPVKSL